MVPLKADDVNGATSTALYIKSWSDLLCRYAYSLITLVVQIEHLVGYVFVCITLLT